MDSKEKKWEKYMTGGNGFILLGAAWLLFWIGPAFFLFEEDSRWGHNFSIPVMFITVGLVYNTNYISCQFTAVISSFMTIPTLNGFWSWSTSFKASLFLLAVFILLYFAEKNSARELIQLNPRLNRWLKIHLLTFAYIGLAHMTLIFFLVRWYNPEPFFEYLPAEHHPDTSAFNIMLLVLVVLSIAERFVEKINDVKVTRLAFYWSVLMIIIPLVIIGIQEV